MAGLEEQFGAILGNPQLMQQIMAIAQSFSTQEPPPPEEAPQPQPAAPEIDPAMIGSLLSMASRTQIDRQQEALLCALAPYLSAPRLQKLEKAMKAANLAETVSAFLPNGMIPFLSGR